MKPKSKRHLPLKTSPELATWLKSHPAKPAGQLTQHPEPEQDILIEKNPAEGKRPSR